LRKWVARNDSASIAYHYFDITWYIHTVRPWDAFIPSSASIGARTRLCLSLTLPQTLDLPYVLLLSSNLVNPWHTGFMSYISSCTLAQQGHSLTFRVPGRPAQGHHRTGNLNLCVTAPHSPKSRACNLISDHRVLWPPWLHSKL